MSETIVLKEKSNEHIVTSGNNLFPVFLKLETLNLLIVGGGNVGLEKLQAVLQNSPATKIRLVSIHVNDQIKELALKFDTISYFERAFTSSDLDYNDVVIIAVNDPEISSHIRGISKQAGKLVNVADQPDLCDFYMGSVV